MKSVGAIVAGAASLAALAMADTVPGFDISHYQTTVDFDSAYLYGARYVFIKATQGSTYTDPDFSSHYEGATQGGFIRGAYHVADPSGASGATQAQYFLSNGGGWTHDGITLPGTLQLVAHSSGSSCYGLSTSAMVSWIKDFSSTYESSTGRYPIIYTDTTWWNSCTGSSTAFASNSPLYVQKFASSTGALPAGWGFYTFWQDNDSFKYGGNSDVFNGAYSQLQSIATGKPSS